MDFLKDDYRHSKEALNDSFLLKKGVLGPGKSLAKFAQQLLALSVHQTALTEVNASQN